MTLLEREHPELLFERFVADGGLLTLNHPVLTPVHSRFSLTSLDISFRTFTAPDSAFPPEILAARRLATGIEAFNLFVTELRDRLLLEDETRSIREVMDGGQVMTIEQLREASSAARGSER